MTLCICQVHDGSGLQHMKLYDRIRESLDTKLYWFFSARQNFLRVLLVTSTALGLLHTERKFLDTNAPAP